MISAPKTVLLQFIDTLEAREVTLKRHGWKCVHPGFDGLGAWKHTARGLGFIHSFGYELDDELWEHLSVSRSNGDLPSWEVTSRVFHEVCGDESLGLIIVPPRSEHVNIAEVTHVWHCLTKRVTPDFTRGTGSI